MKYEVQTPFNAIPGVAVGKGDTVNLSPRQARRLADFLVPIEDVATEAQAEPVTPKSNKRKSTRKKKEAE